MRTKMDSIKEQWQVAELELIEYKNKGFIYLHVRIYALLFSRIVQESLLVCGICSLLGPLT